MALCTNQMNFGCKCMMILIFLASSSKCSNKQGDFYNHHHRHLDSHPSSYQHSYKVEQWRLRKGSLVRCWFVYWVNNRTGRRVIELSQRHCWLFSFSFPLQPCRGGERMGYLRRNHLFTLEGRQCLIFIEISALKDLNYLISDCWRGSWRQALLALCSQGAQARTGCL